MAFSLYLRSGRALNNRPKLIRIGDNSYFPVLLPIKSNTVTYVTSANTIGLYAGSVGLTNTQDTYINESLQTQNFDGQTFGVIGKSGTGDRKRALFRFPDLASLPSGIVTNAQFGFYAESENFTATDLIELRPLSRNYNQTQATWLQFSSGNNWQTAGADGALDRGNVLTSSSAVGSNLMVFSGALLNAWVQACIDGTDSFQTLLAKFVNESAPTVTQNYKTFTGVDGQRPFLRFNLSTAAEPSGFVKVFLGGTWQSKPAKVWNGTAWVQKPVKVWNGSAWIAA